MADKDLTESNACGRGEVAIIGMACIFPKAPDLQTFWQNIVSKVDAISDPPEDSLTSEVYDPASTANNRIYCKRGGYLQDLPPFNPADFGIMPVALDGAEPEHFMALKVAYDALVDAGFPDKPFNRERTGVILGRGTFVNRAYISMLQHVLVVDQTLKILQELHPEHTPAELESIRARLTASLPPFTPDTAPGLPHSVMAGIIANRLNLKGPTLVLDAACASGLLALEMGMRDLLTGKCDVSVIGGVQISTPAPIHMLFTQLGALSHLPHLRPFDRQADGTMLGEGIGIMVLKRTADAIRDGHRIYALVKGVGASSDGKGKGLLAPQVEGEELALRRAYEAAGVSPNSIGLIEAHGTALPLGDLTEIEALRRVFGERDDGPPRVALGTVKSMIGHLIPAAGIAGLIKAALSLHHKILPPTLHVEEPDPKLEIERTPFYLNTATRPWIHGSPHLPRRAGVNSFGFGGINTHAVLEEYPGHTDDLAVYDRTWENELILIDGATRQELISRCEAALEFLAHQSDAALVDIAYSLNRRLEGQPYRLAIVAESRENLNQKLTHALQRLKDQHRSRIKDRSGIYFFENALARQGKVAFLFPGEGSQYVNMLQDLCRHFPEVRRCFDLLDRAFTDHPRNYLPSQVVFPPTEQDASEAGARIWQIDGAVDAVITADRALFRLLSLLGISPQGIVGHSSGELMALEAAGAVALSGDEELVQLIRAGNHMLTELMAAQDIPEGVLLAVGGVDRQAIAAAVETASEFLALAMDNCPHQFVLCGTESSIAEARAKFVEQGGICQTLPFKRAYHTERFEPILKPLRDYFQQATVTSPAVALYSCMTAGPFPPEPEAIRRYAEQQWARPVRFRETIDAMHAEGFRIFVEVGPRSNLVSFVNDILKGQEFLAVATNLHHRSGITQLLHALAMLAAHGVALDLDILYKHRAPRRLDERAVSELVQQPRGVILSRELPRLSLGKTESFTHREKVGAQREASPVAPEIRPAGGSAGGFPIPESREAVLPEKPPAGAVAGPRPEKTLPDGIDMANLSPRPGTQAVMQEYLSTMEDFLKTQEQVMLAYIQGAAVPQAGLEPPPAIRQPEVEPQGQVDSVPENGLPAASPTVEPGAPMTGTQPPEQNLTSRLLAIISDKTGYPLDMLHEHQHLEADLGIDSIKRVEILGMLFQQLGSATVPTENLGSLRTVAEIVEFLSQPEETEKQTSDQAAVAREPETGSTPRAAFTPELPPVLRPGGRLTHLVPHREVRVVRRLDVEEDLFLQDHTLGGQVSQTHPDLLALPVVPLSISLEMMAAVATLLTPYPQLVGMKNIRVHDWLTVAEGHLDLEITARLQAESGRAIEVQLRILDAAVPPSAEPHPAVEGTMIFGDAFAAAPAAGVWQPGGEMASVPTPEEFYPQALFHGPRFRSVREIRQAGETGMEAVLETPPARQFFRDQAASRFLTNPILLDGAGQVVGLWAIAFLETTFVIFPAKIEEVIFYGPPEGLTTPVLCRASPRLEGNSRIVSDIQLVAPDGNLVAHLRGMQHHRARLPKILHLFRGSRQISLSQPWSMPLALMASSDKVVCNRLDPLPVEWSGPDGRIWLEVMAHIALGQEERRTWGQFSGPDKRRLEWLLARLTGKEAVRRLLKECYGFDVWLADIEIYPDKQGKPLVRGEWLNRLGAAPVLSLTHSHGIAVALAADGAADVNVGIDIELIHRPGKGFPNLAFAPEEQHLLPPPESPEFPEWCLRFWCAKEAVAKALGRGLLNGLRDLKVLEANRQTGEILVTATQKLAQDYPYLADKPVQTYTAREGELMVASSFIGKVSENPETAPGTCRHDLKMSMLDS
jgi:acyl transferase domain-containing protein/phosphopantetheinyl transferase/acyl carrier protein